MRICNNNPKKISNFAYLFLSLVMIILLCGCNNINLAANEETLSTTTNPPITPVDTQPTAATIEAGIYKIKNKATGRFLNMQLSGMVDGASVQQYGEADTMEFLWKVVKKGDYYSIQSLLTPRNMSVRKSAEKAGAIIEVRTEEENENMAQFWSFYQYNDSIQIVSAKSGFTMGLTEDTVKSASLPQLVEFEKVDWHLWQFEKVELEEKTPYLLPVEGALFHSSCPEIVKYNDTYYMYIMAPHIAIKYSKDLIHWESIGTAFINSDPSWLAEEVPGYGIWAPGVYQIKDKYYLYYCISTSGSQNSAIGVAVNTTLDHTSPDYKWVDKGLVIRSHPGDDYNCIDPNVIMDENGDVWLTFGSYWNGIYQRQLDPETGFLLEENTEVHHLAERYSNNGAIEAPYIIKRDPYYYLFTAFNPMDNSYHNRVGRSTSVHGPFYDKEGTAMLEGGGTEVTWGLSDLLMPGHASIFLDEDGQYYLVSEYFRKDSPSIMLIGTIVWDEEGWPITALTPNITTLFGK